MQLSMAGIHPDFAQEKKPSHRAVGVSRKDTIIIAMLVNIALLAVLFATASRQSHVALPAKVEPLVSRFETISQATVPVVKTEAKVKEPIDEIDELLKSYALESRQPIVQIEKQAPEMPKEAIKAPASVPKVNTSQFIEVKVKKGDVLSRIARQHNVKVEEIIVLNNLESANVKIGQVLKVPTSKVATSSQNTQQTQIPEYYVVKDGDSPWKIAKKCRINVEDLLKLNHLDEEKARNLKIGQKLRVR